MTCTLLGLALLTTAAPLPPPKGPAPKEMEVNVNPQGRPYILQSVTSYRTVTRTMVVRVGGAVEVHQKQEQVPVVAQRPVYLDSRSVEVFTVDGKKVDPSDLRKRITAKTRVLVSADGKTVDPRHLRSARDDMLVVVCPPPKVPAMPEPPAIRGDFPGRPVPAVPKY